jgi:regulator of sigma E protease
MMTLIYAGVAFGILIFFHELGHFLMAKATRVKVLTFALGFGTKLLRFRWRGTEYALCAFPLGGYVKLLGEDPDEEIPDEERAYSFEAQKVGVRMLITASGVIFNLLLAVAITWILHWGEVHYLTTSVKGVVEGYPAYEAGIKPGDKIVAIDGHRVERWDQLFKLIVQSDGRPLRVTFEREGVTKTVMIKPRPYKVINRYGDEIQLWKIGISGGELASRRFGALGALGQGVKWTLEKTWFTIKTIIRLIQGKESIKLIGSPLLIGMEAGKQAKEAGAVGYFYFIAFISVILAVMNLLPIPILDGGRLVFLAVEGILRRPVGRGVYNVAQYVGIGILVCIMAWAIYRDLDRLYYMKTKDKREIPAETKPLKEPQQR